MKNKMLENYVKALIYMPGINYNRIHKYLLSCCLQQLNKDFVSYNDLKDKRKDLIAAKTYFSKTKQNIKKSLLSACKKNMDEELDENDNELYNLEHNIYEKKEDSNYDIWFKKQKNSNLFISENYENILSNGSGEYIKIIKNNLKRYLETIGNNTSNIVKYLTENIAKINFKQINNNVIKILSKDIMVMKKKMKFYINQLNIVIF